MIGFLPKLIALGAALLLGTWSWIRRAFELLTPKSLRPQSQHLAMDIYLTTATNSLKLFQTGPLSVYRFFHRHDVSRSHELEYLSYVRHHRWGHDKVKPYGLLRIDEVAACDLPSYEAVERELALSYGYGLARLPDAKALLQGRQYGYHEAGYNWLAPPSVDEQDLEREGSKGFSTVEMLEILRKDLAPRFRIAWIEQAFLDELEEGEIAHRYYLDAQANVWLVRHHWSRGKSLFRAETTRAARRSVWEHVPHEVPSE